MPDRRGRSRNPNTVQNGTAQRQSASTGPRVQDWGPGQSTGAAHRTSPEVEGPGVEQQQPRFRLIAKALAPAQTPPFRREAAVEKEKMDQSWHCGGSLEKDDGIHLSLDEWLSKTIATWELESERWQDGVGDGCPSSSKMPQSPRCFVYKTASSPPHDAVLFLGYLPPQGSSACSTPSTPDERLPESSSQESPDIGLRVTQHKHPFESLQEI